MVSKRRPKTRIHEMLVRVRVPAAVTAAQARREVRTLITSKTTFNLDFEDIRAASVKPTFIRIR